MTGPRVLVVGGGISGLAAAYRLRALVPDAQVTVLEAADRLGGALRTVSLAGLAFDVGAEAFLSRRPETTALAAELGLAGELVHPTGAGPTVRAGGHTRPLPVRTVLGVPGDRATVAPVLSEHGCRELDRDRRPLAWEPGGDVAVGALVRDRLGDEVVHRLADPLLGGVYAGRADGLGVRATLPGLAAALDGGASSLLGAAAAVLPPESPAPRPPVFGTLHGGLGTLADRVAAASGATVRLRCPVRSLTRTGTGWRLEVGPDVHPEVLDADAVLLAVPAPALRRLLAGPVPAASAAAARVDVASSVLVGLALPATAALPAASGVLIASGEAIGGHPLTAKAFTYSGRKWAHAASTEVTLVRGSVGRIGDRPVERDDAELVAAVRADLAALTGVSDEPVDTVVARWGGAFPQYAPGHLDLVAALEAAVAAEPGLAVAGSAQRGVGIGACIATADAAAARIAAHLTAVRASGGATMDAWPASTTPR